MAFQTDRETYSFLGQHQVIWMSLSVHFFFSAPKFINVSINTVAWLSLQHCSSNKSSEQGCVRSWSDPSLSQWPLLIPHKLAVLPGTGALWLNSPHTHLINCGDGNSVWPVLSACKGVITCCVSMRSWCLSACYSSYSPQKIWTSVCRCPHIFVTVKESQEEIFTQAQLRVVWRQWTTENTHLLD